MQQTVLYTGPPSSECRAK